MRALLSAVNLLDLLATGAEPVLVDVQWNLTAAGGPPGRDLYAAAHLPGAHHVDLDAELAGPPGPGGRHPLPTAQAVQAALRRCGAHDDSAIVVYDQGLSFAAARAWWVLRHFGARDVRVLDGGLAAWVAAGGATTTEAPPPRDGSFEAHAGGMPVLDAAGAQALARDGVLLDARSPERYRGETEPIDPVAGHIPGARNAPTLDTANPDGTFLPGERLRELFSRTGIRPGDRVGSYCGSGVSAAHQVLALHEAGIEAALYVGSWSDWITDPTRPVATS
ncbi:sulfurtransferase [Nostocoides sp. HKS02]|uniref:sulfurtransferase n=1 Tax=Nostocoides sp. HKS02 TaxID=1813880 RepID=UPI0012B4952D|nr:sulfurtransferase [Tetrasphaera sp. HKS02]QGN56984.1 sulfurtransferase [Tetrasphaera sp. HKS02]